MQIKKLLFYSLIIPLLDSFCFAGSLELQKKSQQIQTKTYLNASFIQPIGESQARLNLINQLQLLLIADDNQDLAQVKNKYPNLSYRSSISLLELTQVLAAFWQMNDQSFQTKTLLEQANVLNAVHPYYQTIESRVLRLIQKQTEMNEAEKRWKWLNLDKPIQLGDSSLSVTAIRERLVLLGDLFVTDKNEHNLQPEVFDLILKDAVMNFQDRHGLKVDGIIGSNTLQWMNLPLSDRAKLLARNFIRQEFWYKSVGDSYVLVNIPQFQLKLVHANHEVLESKVTVGRRGRKTPLIISEISSVVVNPGWNVPSTILRKDLLPKLKDNVNYFDEKNYQVFNEFDDPTFLDGLDISRGLEGKFPYKIYQQPGPDNPLGRFKLHFSNPYSIYLHDTPTHQQFDSVSRAFSSGCVRIEKANEVARWLVASRGVNQKLWQKALDESVDTQWLRLDVPMPIYIVYWTAWMDQNELPQFRQDIYRWENDTKRFALNRQSPLKIASSKTSPAVQNKNSRSVSNRSLEANIIN